jgi:hypothetical protein
MNSERKYQGNYGHWSEGKGTLEGGGDPQGTVWQRIVIYRADSTELSTSRFRPDSFAA